MRIAFAIVLALSLAGCSKAPEDGSDDFAQSVLPDAGVEMQVPEDVTDGEAARILAELLPISEWKTVYPDSSPPQDAKAILFDYRERGRLLSLQRVLGPSGFSMINVKVERAAGIRLRHKIVVGTDLASWKLIRKETTWPEDKPFKQIYLFARPDGQGNELRGLIFLEEVMVEISNSGEVTPKTTDDIEAITWRTAERLEKIYEKEFKPMSEGPLFKDNPVLERPDLPDPDTNGMQD